ncbi:MAG TPA: HD domain-containing protein [Solirubrobacteraceae bacterium]|nr:HD domain-containing protein [Solirubrobacteraceae bacterium]
MQVRELSVGLRIEAPLVVRELKRRTRRDGSELITLRLSDRTGSVPAVIYDGVAEAHETCRAGMIAHVCGVMTEDERFGPRLVVESVRPAAENEYDPADLVDGPSRPIELLAQDLRELVATIQRPCLRTLLGVVLGEGTETWERFRVAPAAKHYHQAYRGGLLEHSLSVAQAVSAISATFPGIDRDVAVAGALVHDIGKLDAYEMNGEAIEMSDGGRLYGEIPLGYFHIRSAIESLPDFPADVAQALLHIILSHHGALEHGSPVVPATREAALVHGIDTLGARLGSFDRIEKAMPDGQQWSGYDKGVGGGAFFAAGVERAA